MCKILMLTDASRVTSVKKFLNAAAAILTHTDNDGFGYAAMGEHGVFGEKSLLVESAFRTRIHDRAPTDKVGQLSIAKQAYESFGQPGAFTGPAILHSRSSTNDINIINTHPISLGGHYLIHNGVVDNEGDKYEMKTTNDTEHLVHYMSTTGIEGIENHVSGYFAFGDIDPEGQLHIGKCDRAQLRVTYSPSIESYIFATTSQIIEVLCKTMKWKYEPIAVVKDNTYAVMRGNEQVSSRDINPIGMRTTRQQAMMGKSLGNQYVGGYGYGGYTPSAYTERTSGGDGYTNHTALPEAYKP